MGHEAGMKSIVNCFQDQPIRLKMFYTYSFIVLIAVLLVGGSVYYQVSKTIAGNIENELSNATATILKLVETTAKSSIRNYLRAVAEKNIQITAAYYAKVKNGTMSEADAKSRLQEIFLSQTIGTTGYIYCLDSRGMAVMHPDKGVEGVNFSRFDFIRKQMSRREGYLEYMWKNPKEKYPRPKALYMAYFEPWDWILSVTSYRSEFSQLINISDFRDSILSQTFGKTGYSYVLVSNGDVVIHPHFSGNLWNAPDANIRFLVRHQCETKNGKLFYSWKNPGEKKFRDKLVIYNYIKEYDWIVASTSYLKEFYAPLTSVRNIMAATILAILLLIFPATFTIARGITRPLQQLERKLSQVADGNFTVRMESHTRDEIGKLAVYFNHFMEQLTIYSQKIETEIDDRRRTEELFFKAFHASPSGIFIVNLNNHLLIDANHSFLNFIGCKHSEVVNKSLRSLSMFRHSPSFTQIADLLKQDGRVRNMDVEFVNAKGNTRLGVIHAETVHIWGERCVLCTVEDQTETKRLEREIIDISERERLQLGQYLHDDLSSHLLGIEVMLKVILRKQSHDGCGDLEAVDKVRQHVKEAIEKTYRIARGLCPTHIAEKELELTLMAFCRDIEQIYDVSCRLQYGEASISLKPQMATHIYYIAREAAYNAVKHGKAHHIVLSLFNTGTTATLEIRDDGCGCSGNIEGKGMGLRIMHYRARRIGATLDIRPDDEVGTRVSLTFNLI